MLTRMISCPIVRSSDRRRRRRRRRPPGCGLGRPGHRGWWSLYRERVCSSGVEYVVYHHICVLESPCMGDSGRTGAGVGVECPKPARRLPVRAGPCDAAASRAVSSTRAWSSWCVTRRDVTRRDAWVGWSSRGVAASRRTGRRRRWGVIQRARATTMVVVLGFCRGATGTDAAMRRDGRNGGRVHVCGGVMVVVSRRVGDASASPMRGRIATHTE